MQPTSFWACSSRSCLLTLSLQTLSHMVESSISWARCCDVSSSELSSSSFARLRTKATLLDLAPNSCWKAWKCSSQQELYHYLCLFWAYFCLIQSANICILAEIQAKACVKIWTSINWADKKYILLCIWIVREIKLLVAFYSIQVSLCSVVISSQEVWQAVITVVLF